MMKRMSGLVVGFSALVNDWIMPIMASRSRGVEFKLRIYTKNL